jgi:hypothetical protein
MMVNIENVKPQYHCLWNNIHEREISNYKDVAGIYGIASKRTTRI